MLVKCDIIGVGARTCVGIKESALRCEEFGLSMKACGIGTDGSSFTKTVKKQARTSSEPDERFA